MRVKFEIWLTEDMSDDVTEYDIYEREEQIKYDMNVAFENPFKVKVIAHIPLEILEKER